MNKKQLILLLVSLLIPVSCSFAAQDYPVGKWQEHYQLSFNNPKMSFDAGNQLSEDAVVNNFVDSYSLPWEDGANKIYITLYTHNISELDINVKLPEANISKEKIIDKIKKMDKIDAPFFRNPKITNLFTLNKELVLIKGTYLYVTDEVNMDGYEHPYFGIFSINKDKILIIEDNYALLRVFLIDGKYYFVTHFQKPESCARGLVIYRLEKGALVRAFDYSKE